MTPPAPATQVVFTVNHQGWTVLSITIYVDGAAQATSWDANLGRANAAWNSSQATNPSEHHTYAIARVRAPWNQEKDIDSRVAAPLGDGGPGAFFVEDIHVESLEFLEGLTLRRRAAEPGDDGLLPRPQYRWEANGANAARSSCGYVRSSTPSIKLRIGSDLDGDATMAVGVVIRANSVAIGDYITLFSTSPPATFTGEAVTLTAANALAGCVDIEGLDITVQLYLVPRGTTSYLPVGAPRTSYGSMFVTLDSPVAPMAEPWEGILETACASALGAQTAEAARYYVTGTAYRVSAYAGVTHTHTISDTAQEFYLEDFLLGTDEAYPRHGQCTDLADFLVCLSNALGAGQLAAQRSALLADIREGFAFLTTNSVTLAPDLSGNGVAEWWRFHQWTTVGTVYDPCIRFLSMMPVANMDLGWIGAEGTYVGDLVDASEPHPCWSPQPAFGFLPTILNRRPLE